MDETFSRVCGSCLQLRGACACSCQARSLFDATSTADSGWHGVERDWCAHGHDQPLMARFSMIGAEPKDQAASLALGQHLRLGEASPLLDASPDVLDLIFRHLGSATRNTICVTGNGDSAVVVPSDAATTTVHAPVEMRPWPDMPLWNHTVPTGSGIMYCALASRGQAAANRLLVHRRVPLGSGSVRAEHNSPRGGPARENTILFTTTDASSLPRFKRCTDTGSSVALFNWRTVDAPAVNSPQGRIVPIEPCQGSIVWCDFLGSEFSTVSIDWPAPVPVSIGDMVFDGSRALLITDSVDTAAALDAIYSSSSASSSATTVSMPAASENPWRMCPLVRVAKTGRGFRPAGRPVVLDMPRFDTYGAPWFAALSMSGRFLVIYTRADDMYNRQRQPAFHTGMACRAVFDIGDESISISTEARLIMTHGVCVFDATSPDRVRAIVAKDATRQHWKVMVLEGVGVVTYPLGFRPVHYLLGGVLSDDAMVGILIPDAPHTLPVRIENMLPLLSVDGKTCIRIVSVKASPFSTTLVLRCAMAAIGPVGLAGSETPSPEALTPEPLGSTANGEVVLLATLSVAPDGLPRATTHLGISASAALFSHKYHLFDIFSSS